jgi:hypothetical protein
MLYTPRSQLKENGATPLRFINNGFMATCFPQVTALLLSSRPGLDACNIAATHVRLMITCHIQF